MQCQIDLDLGDISMNIYEASCIYIIIYQIYQIYIIIYQIGAFTKEYGTYIGDLKVIPTRSQSLLKTQEHPGII